MNIHPVMGNCLLSCECSCLILLVKQGRKQDCVGRGLIPCQHDKGRCPGSASSDDTVSEKEKAEFHRYYQAGRMDVLFSLVNDGIITIYDAANFAGMTLEEADDMLQGWKVAQEIGRKNEEG